MSLGQMQQEWREAIRLETEAVGAVHVETKVFDFSTFPNGCPLSEFVWEHK